MKGFLPPKMALHSAVIVGTNMYIYGGNLASQINSARIYLADLRSRGSSSWSLVAAKGMIPLGRMVAGLHYTEGLLIVYGGYSELLTSVRTSLDVFDIRYSEWHSGGIMDVVGESPSRKHDAAVQQSDGVVYFTPEGIYKLKLMRLYPEPKRSELQVLVKPEIISNWVEFSSIFEVCNLGIAFCVQLSLRP